MFFFRIRVLDDVNICSYASVCISTLICQQAIAFLAVIGNWELQIKTDSVAIR